MKIAFCDDDKYFLSLYDDLISKITIIPGIDSDGFPSGETLLEQYKIDKSPYDVVFLDIEMDKLNGLETAKKIRLYDENVLIIFITSHTEYVYESFEVTPFRFLIKPIDSEKIKDVLLAAYNKITNDRKCIYFNIERSIIRLNINDILYMESDKRILIIHANNQTYKVYDKLSNYQEKLYQNGFISVHKSYLINLNHVVEFNTNTLKVSNGDIIPISENKRKYAKEEHMKFMLRSYIHDGK